MPSVQRQPHRPLPRLQSAGLALWVLAACGSTPTRGSAPVADEPRDAGVVELGASLHVTSDVRLASGEYLRPVPDGAEAVIVLEGLRGVVLDLSGVRLRGAADEVPLERLTGTGILVRDSRDIVVRGGQLGGYRTCVAIEDSRNVVVEDVRFEGWYAQRLSSSISAESSRDWLDVTLPGPQWRERYGAALWVRGSELVEVRRCEGRRGQNGMLLVDSGHCDVYDNDFSFLSGWGLGLWGSSGNKVSHNILDYCVRGYSHDVYSSGHDSAAFLLTAGSSDNVFAHNSATHSGNGVLVRGRSSAQAEAPGFGQLEAGGCDRNAWIENDLRYAVAAGIDLRNSAGNLVLRNLLSAAHGEGLVASFCGETVVVGNEIEDVSGRGIQAIGCQDFLIADNSLRHDQIGLELAAADEELVREHGVEDRERTSRGHWVQENEFADNDQDLVLKDTRGLVFWNNTYPATNRSLYVEGLEVAGVDGLAPLRARAYLESRDGSRPSGYVQRAQIDPCQGQDHVRLHEARSRRTLGLAGERRAFKHAGRELGLLDSILMGEWGPWDFRGGSARPAMRLPGGLLGEADWDAVWFTWDSRSDPRGDLDVWRAQRFAHVARATVGNFRNPWGTAQVRQELGSTSFGLIAYTDVEVPEGGRHRLTVVCDDGLRLSFDGEAVLEDWVWHPRPKKHVVEMHLAAGSHRVGLEYFQIEGSAALTIDLERLDL